jgi:NDP-sugar pyrophosphorylase family protein
MVNSDFVTDCDLAAAVEAHRKSGATATMVLTPPRPGTHYGSVDLDADGRVLSIAGKPPLPARPSAPQGDVPAPAPTGYTFTGIHVLEPAVLDLIPPGDRSEINRDIYPLIVQGKGLIKGYIFEGFWRELGTPRLYLDGSMTVLGEDREESLKPFRQSAGIYLENLKLPKSTTLAPPVLIGRGTVVGQGCSFLGGVVIGKQCLIGNECALRSSMLWDGARLGERTQLTECIVTSGVYVPAGSSLSGRILFRVDGYQGKKDNLERVGNCWMARLQ